MRGHGRGRGYVLPSDISGGQYGAIGGEHSHAITGVVNAGSSVVVVLCFRLRLIVSFCSADGWLEERPHLLGGGRQTAPYLVWGLVPEFAVVAIWFRTWNAQDTTSAHKDG